MTKSANDNMTSLHLIRNEASNWGNWVVAYLCIQTVWTMDITVAWKTSCKCKHVATRVGSFALHIIFCLGLIGGGGQLPPVPSNDAPGVESCMYNEMSCLFEAVRAALTTLVYNSNDRRPTVWWYVQDPEVIKPKILYGFVLNRRNMKFVR